MATMASMEAAPSFQTVAGTTGAEDDILKRRQDFTLFKRIAQAFYRTPPAELAHRRMAARCGYGVAVGGETPCRTVERLGADARTVEVYYGERKLTGYQPLAQQRLRETWRGATEKGASLLYAQGDDSVVTVYLHPAETDAVKAEEDGILLARYQDLEAMTGRGVLESHWGALRAYAEVTSLDGEPTLAQTALTRWLRFTRPVIRDGRRRPAAMLDMAQSVLRYAGAVLLGAWLITALF